MLAAFCTSAGLISYWANVPVAQLDRAFPLLIFIDIKVVAASKADRASVMAHSDMLKVCEKKVYPMAVKWWIDAKFNS